MFFKSNLFETYMAQWVHQFFPIISLYPIFSFFQWNIICVATGIATGRRIEKRNGFKKDLGVATIVILENHKDKTSLRKTIFWIRESVTRREGVSTLPRPPKDGTFN